MFVSSCKTLKYQNIERILFDKCDLYFPLYCAFCLSPMSDMVHNINECVKFWHFHLSSAHQYFHFSKSRFIFKWHKIGYRWLSNMMKVVANTQYTGQWILRIFGSHPSSFLSSNLSNALTTRNRDLKIFKVLYPSSSSGGRRDSSLGGSWERHMRLKVNYLGCGGGGGGGRDRDRDFAIKI